MVVLRWHNHPGMDNFNRSIPKNIIPRLYWIFYQPTKIKFPRGLSEFAHAHKAAVIGDNTMGALIMCFKLVPKMVAEADTRIQNVEEIKPGGV